MANTPAEDPQQTRIPDEPFDEDTRRELALLEQLRRISIEDDFAGALGPLNRYPQISRDLSLFERDVRDWGFMFGLAFGLALSEWPEEPRPDIARLAFEPAHLAYVRWAGEIQDPVVRRETAVRAILSGFDEARQWPFRDKNGRATMTTTLQNALSDLAEAEGA